MNQKPISDAERLAKLAEIAELIKIGNAGISKTGQLVDIRQHPEATPIPPQPSGTKHKK